jgi:hypothetical protein
VAFEMLRKQAPIPARSGELVPGHPDYNWVYRCLSACVKVKNARGSSPLETGKRIRHSTVEWILISPGAPGPAKIRRPSLV